MIFTSVSLWKNTTRNKTLKFQKDNFEVLQKNRDTLLFKLDLGR